MRLLHLRIVEVATIVAVLLPALPAIQALLARQVIPAIHLHALPVTREVPLLVHRVTQVPLAVVVIAADIVPVAALVDIAVDPAAVVAGTPAVTDAKMTRPCLIIKKSC